MKSSVLPDKELFFFNTVAVWSSDKNSRDVNRLFKLGKILVKIKYLEDTQEHLSCDLKSRVILFSVANFLEVFGNVKSVRGFICLGLTNKAAKVSLE